MIAPVPELLTKRFRLRGLLERDVDALWPSFSDDKAMLYWSRGAFASQAELRDWLFDTDWPGQTWIAEPAEGGPALCRVVADTNSDQLCEIGYLTVLGRERQGIAKECVTGLIDHLFGSGEVRKIIADIDPRNDASNHLIKSLGFTQEAHLRDAMKTHIGWCDSLIWGLLAREWTG